MKKTTLLLAFMALLSFGIVSCNNQDDPEPTDDTETTDDPEISEEAKTSGETVKTDEDAQTEKEKGEQSVNDETVESSSSNELSEEEQAALEAITGSSASEGKIAATNEGVSSMGWYLAEINGVKTTEEERAIYFFSPLGYYFQYYLETEEWDWSYYYTNDAMDLMVLDLGSETRQQEWEINNVNTANKQMTVLRDGTDSLVFKSFHAPNFEERHMDASTLASIIGGKEFFRAFDFRAGDHQVLDTASHNGGLGFDTLNAIQIETDGTFETYRKRVNFSLGSPPSPGLIKHNLRSGTWEMVEEGRIRFTYNDNDEIMGFNIKVAKPDHMDITGFVDLDKDQTPEKVNWHFVTLGRLNQELFPSIQ